MGNNEERYVILLVDDEEDVSSGLADYINHKYSDFFVASAIFGKETLTDRTMEYVRMSKPDLVVMDLVLNGVDGVDLVQMVLSELDDKVCIIYLTGCPKQDKLRKKADETGYPSILKPCSGRDVVSKIKESLGCLIE